YLLQQPPVGSTACSGTIYLGFYRCEPLGCSLAYWYSFAPSAGTVVPWGPAGGISYVAVNWNGIAFSAPTWHSLASTSNTDQVWVDASNLQHIAHPGYFGCP